MRYKKTEWGLHVKMFTQEYGVTLKEITKACGIHYNTLLQVMIGKTPGDNVGVITKVDAFIESYIANLEPNLRDVAKGFDRSTPHAM